MKPYGQYCPIARASQVLAERWTPIILRNLLLGSTTFSEIRRRPQDLADPAHHPAPRAGAGRRRPDDAQPQRTWVPLPAHRGRKGPGGRHEGPGELGRALDGAGPEHLDPGVVLHSWVSWYLARERLPERRVIARFQFPGLPRKDGELWIIFDGQRSEVCRKDPGFEVELYVQAEPAASPSGTWAGSNGPTPSGPSGSGSWDRQPWPGRCRPGTAAVPPPGHGKREAGGVPR
jgi:hypothetical protein